MSRLRAAGPSAARTRARWALGTLVGVNALMLWFFLGMTASLGWHAKLLDETTLRSCAASALDRTNGDGRSVSPWSADLTGARFVGDATIRFVGDFDTYDDETGEGTATLEVECTLAVADGDSSTSAQLVVRRARVVG
ncbi:MAG: hypothetical protein ABIR39_06475 [Nocardioides sp.]|uniref:hypothetical protein n=1 Tax=Nocardioides sp. TaxID=35761 RepID=UPI0032663FEB